MNPSPCKTDRVTRTPSIPWRMALSVWGDLAGVSEHSYRALANGNRFGGGIAFAAGFEKVIETRVRAE